MVVDDVIQVINLTMSSDDEVPIQNTNAMISQPVLDLTMSSDEEILVDNTNSVLSQPLLHKRKSSTQSAWQQ